MTNQTDEKNLKATGNAGNVSTETKTPPAQQTEPAKEAPKNDPVDLGKKHEPEVTRHDLKDTKPAILDQNATTVTAQKSVEEKAAEVAAKEAELNAHNEEGNAKNVERDEEAAIKGHEKSHYDRAQQEGGEFVEGKRIEENRNTPIVDPKTGAKRWV